MRHNTPVPNGRQLWCTTGGLRAIAAQAPHGLGKHTATAGTCAHAAFSLTSTNNTRLGMWHAALHVPPLLPTAKLNRGGCGKQVAVANSCKQCSRGVLWKA